MVAVKSIPVFHFSFGLSLYFLLLCVHWGHSTISQNSFDGHRWGLIGGNLLGGTRMLRHFSCCVSCLVVSMAIPFTYLWSLLPVLELCDGRKTSPVFCVRVVYIFWFMIQPIWTIPDSLGIRTQIFGVRARYLTHYAMHFTLSGRVKTNLLLRQNNL